MPIMYYNLPSASGVKLTATQFGELQRAGVSCLKDTGGDTVAATELIPTGRRCSTAGTPPFCRTRRRRPRRRLGHGLDPSRSNASSCTGS